MKFTDTLVLLGSIVGFSGALIFCPAGVTQLVSHNNNGFFNLGIGIMLIWLGLKLLLRGIYEDY